MLGPPKPTPYLRSVLSAREMAGFLTALLQAALLLRGEKQPQRGLWRHCNAAMSNLHTRAKPRSGTAAVSPLAVLGLREEEEAVSICCQAAGLRYV